jgi:hypothetical protein
MPTRTVWRRWSMYFIQNLLVSIESVYLTDCSRRSCCCYTEDGHSIIHLWQ